MAFRRSGISSPDVESLGRRYIIHKGAVLAVRSCLYLHADWHIISFNLSIILSLGSVVFASIKMDKPGLILRAWVQGRRDI
jgi:hypothetical protein